MNQRQKLSLGLFATACFAIGFVLYLVVFKPIRTSSIDVNKVSMVGKPRPAFTMNDTSDKPHRIADWDGKVILLNFWATWCPPCRREIPAFINLYEHYHDKGLVVVGVALDSKQNAIDFVDPMGINYPVVIGEQDGIALSQAYGDSLSILPYTVVIDRQGIIRHTILHELTEEQAERLIKPLL